MQNRESYYCNITVDTQTGENYYVKLINNKNSPVINFNQFKNILTIKINFSLAASANLPPNLIRLNLISNIGEFKNIQIKQLNASNSFLKKYESTFTINLNSISSISKNSFLEEFKFTVNFDINQEVLNNSNIVGDINKFWKDLSNITFSENIYFNNYFPISKLSEFYIADKYKSDFYNLTSLPNDLFTWANKKMTINSEFWFVKSQDFTNLNYKNSINKIYYSNVENSSFTKSFDSVNISITYYVNDVKKEMKLDLTSKPNLNIQEKNALFLGVKTLYNFEKDELYQSDNGISGIYFPKATHGEINLSLIKNNILYSDKINFTFANNFYSPDNKNLNIELATFTDVSGQWTEITYA